MESKDILLIGNSRQVIKMNFPLPNPNLSFEYVCRFNHNWANIYERISKHTGSGFNALITSHYAHDQSVRELKECGLFDKVTNIFLICPNENHKYPIQKVTDKSYTELTTENYNTISAILFNYGFPLASKIPRTGLIAIVYFSFILNYNVYVYGFDIDGVDDPNNQHVNDNHKIDLNAHDINAESEILKQFIDEKNIFVYS